MNILPIQKFSEKTNHLLTMKLAMIRTVHVGVGTAANKPRLLGLLLSAHAQSNLMQKMADFNYTRAVVCGVPASLPGAALRLGEPGEPVNLEKARKQHDEYVKVSYST